MLLMMTPQDETVLLAKAFGDLDQRPFAWCFESPDDHDDHLRDDTHMITVAAAAADDEPTQPDAAPQEPQEGVTYTMSGDAFLAMLRRHLGMPDESQASSADGCDTSGCATLAPLHTCGICGGNYCERHCDYQTTWYDDMPAHVCYDCLRGEVDYVY